MAQSTIVCSNCGVETTYGDAMMYDRDGCEVRGGHDWSDDDPLARLEAHVSASAGMEVYDSEDNEGWQWIEVDLTDHDRVAASEGLANLAFGEGFGFIGVSEESDDSAGETLRFNRQK